MLDPDCGQDAIIKFYIDYNKRCPVTFHKTLYDTYYDVLEKRLLREAIARYHRKGPSTSRALDLGCGAGRYLKLLSNLKVNVIGSDIAFESLLDLKNTCSDLVCLDAQKLAFKDELFSLIISMFGVLSHCYHTEEALKEARRVLKKGGIFIFSVCSWRPLCSILSIKGIINKFNKYIIGRTKRRDQEEYAFGGHIYTRAFWSGSMAQMLKGAGFELLEIRGISILAGLFHPQLADKFPNASKVFYKLAFPIDYLILSRLPLVRDFSNFLLFVVRKV